MFSLFKKKEEVAHRETPVKKAPPSHVAPGTRISFHPELIESLKDDHQALLRLYTEISQLFKERDFTLASERLEQLRNELRNHLLTENIKLYIYLAHEFEGDAKTANLIHNFRRENDKIGRTALKFLQTYTSATAIEAKADIFLKEWKGLGEVLVQRIEREESVLYPLYNSAE